jgi:hypothetical protein
MAVKATVASKIIAAGAKLFRALIVSVMDLHHLEA